MEFENKYTNVRYDRYSLNYLTVFEYWYYMDLQFRYKIDPILLTLIGAVYGLVFLH